MSKNVNFLISSVEQQLTNNWQLIRHESLMKIVGNHVLPFDFTGNEPENDPMWNIVRFYIAKGYLTDDLQPTSHALEMDFIRYNDGSRIFEQMDQQPALLITGKFLLRMHEHYNLEIGNILKKMKDHASNQ